MAANSGFGLSCTQVRENKSPGQTLSVPGMEVSGIEVRFPIASITTIKVINAVHEIELRKLTTLMLLL